LLTVMPVVMYWKSLPAKPWALALRLIEDRIAAAIKVFFIFENSIFKVVANKKLLPTLCGWEAKIYGNKNPLLLGRKKKRQLRWRGAPQGAEVGLRVL